MNKSLLKQRIRTLESVRTAKGLQSRANELGVKLPQYKSFKDDERLIKYREFLLREYSIKLNELESEFSNTRMISKSKLTYQETGLSWTQKWDTRGIKIAQFDLEGNLIHIWNSISECERLGGFYYGTIQEFSLTQKPIYGFIFKRGEC